MYKVVRVPLPLEPKTDFSEGEIVHGLCNRNGLRDLIPKIKEGEWGCDGRGKAAKKRKRKRYSGNHRGTEQIKTCCPISI